jgi:quinoprotein glucose dehydrogenase
MKKRKSGPFLARWTLLLVAFIALLVSLAMALPGAWLAVLGGSFYYLLAGIAGAWSCWMILRGRYRTGVGLFLLVVLGTLAWALWEIDRKAWMHAWGFDLAGRIGLHLALLIAMLVPLSAMRRGVRRDSDGRRAAIILGIPLVLLVAGTLIAVRWQDWTQPQASGPAVIETPPVAQRQTGPGVGRAGAKRGPEEWTAFGGSNLGQRFSVAEQITPANVARLEQAWEFRTGDEAPSDRVYYAFQNTPLKIDDSLYVCSSANQVFALDPATGRQQWHFDPEIDPDAMEPLFSVACRTLGYHEVSTPQPGQECPRRILLATVDSRLIALDAATGERCPGFGEAGTVDLSDGMANQAIGLSSSTSGPAIVGDLAIVGQQVSDNQRRDAPSGVTRAFDVNTGALRWAWDAKRTRNTEQPLAEGEIWPRGTPNVWTLISADEELGLVYLATGNAANDHFGGDRDPEDEAFTSSVVAVDAQTGATRWHFRTVDHDLWDYDLGAQPTLLDLDIDGQTHRALVQGTKTGAIFVLDALSGEPLFPVERRAAPQGAVHGDRTAPNQPLSTRFPNFAGAPGREPERIDESHLFGLTPFDALFCRIQFNRMRYEGIFTPPTDQGDGMLLFPGTIGGLNWGGVSVNPEEQILITNNSRLPNRVKLYPRDQVDDEPIGRGGTRPDQDIAPQAGSPYGVDRPMWLSPLGVPCIAPPWGYLSATDLRTGRLLWSQPLGTGFDMGPLGIPSRLKIRIGTPNIGGSVNTRSGLTFIAAAQDNYLRAFETRTGKQLWDGRLPAGGQASPMTYLHQGRQYVVIAAGGHARLETKTGDSVVAFALPE